MSRTRLRTIQAHDRWIERSRKLSVETLEDRRVLTASFNASGFEFATYFAAPESLGTASRSGTRSAGGDSEQVARKVAAASPAPPPDGVTYWVNIAADAVPDGEDGGCEASDSPPASDAPKCTLRMAITEANKSSARDKVHFRIPGAGPHVIQPEDLHLPFITQPIIIDGYTQPGGKAAEGTGVASIQIELNGTKLSKSTNEKAIKNGLVLDDPGSSVIRGLSITEFTGGRTSINGVPVVVGGSGIVVNSDDGQSVISGNHIGLAPDGNTKKSNNFGISVVAGNTIGGSTPGDRNVISGNEFSGIILGSIDTNRSRVIIPINARIQGNYIGTDATGTKAFGNSLGVYVSLGAKETEIGGTTDAMRNIISGNEKGGILVGTTDSVSAKQSDNERLNPAAKDTKILRNYVGTDVTGLMPLGNGGDKGNAIELSKAENSEVSHNVIAASNAGILISGSSSKTNTVASNKIGSDKDGEADPKGKFRHNFAVGISDGASNNTIGGEADVSLGQCAVVCNFISGNGVGVYITGEESTDNKIQGNLIGSDLAGLNTGSGNIEGIVIESPKNLVGGDEESHRNLISGNTSRGIFLRGMNAAENTIANNYRASARRGAEPRIAA